MADDPAAYLSAIPEGPPDGILGIAQNFKACTAANKVNLVIGAYRTEEGEPWVLPSGLTRVKLAPTKNGGAQPGRPLARP